MADWAGKSIFVTGATGFIGRRLVRRLSEAGAKVWAGVYPQEQPERVASLSPHVKRVALDVRDAESVRQAVKVAAPWVVFHLAAAGVANPGIDPPTALATNTGGTINLLETLREQVGRIVLTGTCHEYGAREAGEGLDPSSFYAASKVAAWAFARAYWRTFAMPVVVVRLFQVYGPGQANCALIPAAVRAALAGKGLTMTPGKQERDFVYVDDVVEGMLAAAETAGIEGQSLDLGTGHARPIHEVIWHIWKMTEAKGHILRGALPYRAGTAMRLVADADRTAALTGWRATTTLEEGLKRTIRAISATMSETVPGS